jgi:poly-gamma-glutamate synthesis protein (capsule biosynthesis protein)
MRSWGILPGFLLAVAGTVHAADTLDTTRPKPKRQPVVISWVGDVYLAGSVNAMAQLRGMDYVLADLSDTLKADSLTVANLEGSVSTTGRPEQGKEYTFQSPPGLLDGLKGGGIEMVSLANNHVLDFGKGALLEMLGHLRAAGLRFGGAGENADSAAAPAWFTIAGQRLAVLCYSRVIARSSWHAGRNSSGVAGAYDPQRLLASIAAARDSGALVAVYLHWGKEKKDRPEPYQRALAYRCIEAGAHLVIGSHPHVLQGFEFYRGRLIAYSLGNFVFSNRDGRPTVVLRTAFLGDSLVSASVVPCRIPFLRPELMRDEPDRQRLFSYLTGISTGVVVDSAGRLWPVGP